MFAHQAVAIGALFLSSAVPAVAYILPRDNPWTTVPNPLVSSSLSQTTTVSASSSSLSQTTSTGTSFSTSTRSASSSQSAASSPPPFPPNVPYICLGGLCFALPNSQQPGTGTAHAPPAASASASACAQPPQIPAPRVPTPLFNFTEKCNAKSNGAEDCRATLACDTSRGLHPTCEDGECKCLSKPCVRSSVCSQYNHCRNDYEDAVCHLNATTGTGTCGCQPRITDCLFQESPHHACAAGFNCTEKHFSAYPEFPHCSTGETRFARGRCECRHFDCTKTGDERDLETCKDLIQCGNSTLGHRPVCILKYGEHNGKTDGYCTCIP